MSTSLPTDASYRFLNGGHTKNGDESAKCHGPSRLQSGTSNRRAENLPEAEGLAE